MKVKKRNGRKGLGCQLKSQSADRQHSLKLETNKINVKTTKNKSKIKVKTKRYGMQGLQLKSQSADRQHSLKLETNKINV